jgi:hypothetical protein
MIEFSSLNPYQSLVAISGSSPEELVSLIKQIQTPVKIISITSNGTRQVAYVIGDIRKKQIIPKPKGK